MSIEGQGHFFTIYFPGFVCFVLYLAKISGERLQDHWSSGQLDESTFILGASGVKHGRCTLTQISRVDFPILINWMSPLSFLGASGVIFSFYSIFQ